MGFTWLSARRAPLDMKPRTRVCSHDCKASAFRLASRGGRLKHGRGGDPAIGGSKPKLVK